MFVNGIVFAMFLAQCARELICGAGDLVSLGALSKCTTPFGLRMRRGLGNECEEKRSWRFSLCFLYCYVTSHMVCVVRI